LATDPVRALAARVGNGVTLERPSDPEHGDWPDLLPVPEPPGAALDLLDRSIAAGAAVIGIGPFTNLAAYETLRAGRLRAPTLMAGYAEPPAPGLPPWGPEHAAFNSRWLDTIECLTSARRVMRECTCPWSTTT